MGDFNTASFYGDDVQDLRGPPGEKGDQGQQGDPGPRGEDGKDAFQVWLEQGNTGSPSDFLSAQQGPPGRDGKNAAYRFGTFATTGILPSEILMDHLVVAACTLGANFSGSMADCGSPPVSLWTATILRNDVSVGHLAIDGEGLSTMQTVEGLPVALNPGDVVTLIAPEDPDEQIERLRVTFSAELPDPLPSTGNA